MPSPAEMYRPELLPESSQKIPARSIVQDPHQEPAYYDVPMLKAPVWKWEIASYFFLGGMVAGSYILARIAERAGGKEYRQITRIGTYTACAAIIPCPLLLIHDLGDPARFHHMLRIWKPKSPMNLGTWVLTAFSGVAYAAGARELLRTRATRTLIQRKVSGTRSGSGRGALNVVAGTLGILSDVVGLPLAMALAAYTGVLVSNSATPVWARNNWLSPLFVIGGMSSGASMIGLITELQKNDPPLTTRPEQSLKIFSTLAHAAEAATFAGYLGSLSKEVRKPYTSGTMKHHTAFTFAGLLAAEVLKHMPVPKRYEKPTRVVGHVISLASAFSMRWSVIYAAHESGTDPKAARDSSRSKNPEAYRWLTDPQRPTSAPPRERTEAFPDHRAISTLDPNLGYNPNHR